MIKKEIIDEYRKKNPIKSLVMTDQEIEYYLKNNTNKGGKVNKKENSVYSDRNINKTRYNNHIERNNSGCGTNPIRTGSNDVYFMLENVTDENEYFSIIRKILNDNFLKERFVFLESFTNLNDVFDPVIGFLVRVEDYIGRRTFYRDVSDFLVELRQIINRYTYSTTSEIYEETPELRAEHLITVERCRLGAEYNIRGFLKKIGGKIFVMPIDSWSFGYNTRRLNMLHKLTGKYLITPVLS